MMLYEWIDLALEEKLHRCHLCGMITYSECDNGLIDRDGCHACCCNRCKEDNDYTWIAAEDLNISELQTLTRLLDVMN